MIVKLPIRAARGLPFVSLAVFCLLAYFSIRNARATHAIELNTRAGYERAVRLEPADARKWYLLGRSYQDDFEQPDPDAALHAFLVSRSLNPLSADTLLGLAANFEQSGKLDSARESYLDAARVYPSSADVHWSYGNFLLRQNQIPHAFEEIRKSLALDPKRSAEAFSRCLRVVPAVPEILEKVIPQNMRSYMDIIFDLTNGAQLDTAMQVWSRAYLSPGSVNLVDVTRLADSLIQSGRFADVALLWKQATEKMANPIPPDPPGSVLWDGGFESSFSSHGLGWYYGPVVKTVQAAIDTHEKHSGAQSLRLLFAGRTNLYFSDICHVVIVEPGKSYRLSAWIRTKGITSDQGLRFVLYGNSNGNMATVATPEVHGDSEWTTVTALWTAPRDTHFASVCAARYPTESPDGEIAGIAWIDDVALVPVAAEPPKR
ncbi:MAG TPA: tetratricopeptide repeat protein [Candidatus Acidoferrum sp.]|nr:tetratricopeptide repeat protein [Candidatus Acidoferrum sp.]